jgi:hypothetical protein
MLTLSQQIIQEVDNLVSAGEQLAFDASTSSRHLGPEKVQELSSIATRVGQLIQRLYGDTSQYKANLDRVLRTENFSKVHAHHWHHVSELVGIIRGIQSDIRLGLLNDFRALIQAEIFADFLEMAEYLLSAGYKDASAVLLGGVLEDSLRKLALKNAIPITGSNGKPLTIEPTNVALAKANVYGPLIKKQITSWADLRNDAAHGNYAKYDTAQVQQMLLFVQKFCSDFLT